jgi:hypothetical protein
MAYDASNNQPDQNQVVSSTPLSGGQQPAAQTQPQDSQPNQAPSQPSTVQAGMSSTQAGAAQQPTQQKSASSGMFTNIQKYVQKNKPQAQKMASAVTENVGSQASEIAEQAKQKEAQMQQSLQANQQAMEQQKQEAAGIVGNVMGANYDPTTGQFQAQPAQPQVTPEMQQQPAQPPQVAEEQQARFQELMKGPTGVSEVGNLNIAQENQKARALQQLAGTANTEMGRRGLLQDTFRQGGKEYTQGMGSLDQLITSGDQQAREQLVTGVQEQAQGLQDQLQQVGSDANKAKMAQDMAMQQFGTDISQLGADAQAAIIGQVDEQVTAQQAAFQDQIDKMTQAAQQQFESAQGLKSAEDFYRSMQSQFAPKWSKAGNREWQDYMSIQQMLDPNFDMGQALRDRGIGGWTTDAEGNQVEMGTDQFGNITLGTRGQEVLQNSVNQLLQNAADYGLDPNTYRQQLDALKQNAMRKELYGWSGHQSNRVGDIQAYDKAKFQDTVNQIFQDIGSARENALQRQLENKYKDQYGDALGEGQTYEDFVSGDWIDRAGVANQDQTSRMAALRNLMGSQTDELGTELDGQYGQDTSFFQRLKGDLAGYKPTAKTGGTVTRDTTGGGGPIKKVV